MAVSTRKAATTVGQRRRTPCADCRRDTNHEVLASVLEHWSEEGGESGWSLREIIVCLGCDRQQFRLEIGVNGDIDPTTDEQVTSEIVYPKYLPGLGTRPFSFSVPPPVARLSAEVRSALADGNTTLAAIGLRALLEAVCRAEGAKGRTLAVRIQGLVKLGRIGTEAATLLDPIRHVGNDAAHEAKAPDQEELLVAVAIIDHLLDGVYVLKEGVERIQQGIAERKAKAAAAKKAAEQLRGRIAAPEPASREDVG